MAIYDFVKDAMGIAQKADNIDLYRKLLEIGRMALDLQNENAELKKKIEELIRSQQLEQDIIRHIEPYFTLKSDGQETTIFYCATCYGREGRKIQMYYDGESKLYCPACNTSFSMRPAKKGQKVYF